MLTDEQLIQRLRDALESEAAEVDPPPGLLASIHDELLTTSPTQNRSWPTPTVGGLLSSLAAAAAVAVAVLALTIAAHHQSITPIRTTDAVPSMPSATTKLPLGTTAGPGTADPNSFQGAAIASTVKLVAETPDPHGGLPWGLRTFQTTRGQTCLQVGRVQDGTIGVIGQDGAWGDDHRFHPISPNAYTADSCSQTDANGNAFNNVSTNGGIASADVPWGTGRQSGECRIGAQPSQYPICPPADRRDLDYGLLGPDATGITFVGQGGRLFSEPTNGPDGAYLIVRAASTQPCSTHPGGGRTCVSGGGQTSGPSVPSGAITAVSYRDEPSCHLPTPTSSGVAEASCPAVGYTPRRAERITAAQVTAPITIRKLPAKYYCLGRTVQSWIPCDSGVPRGYKRVNPGGQRMLLVAVSFTARVAVTGGDSEYEWELSYPQSLTCGAGGSSGTTLANIRAGQRIIDQEFVPYSCPGVVTGSIGFLRSTGAAGFNGPNGVPGRDGSILVGRFSFTMP